VVETGVIVLALLSLSAVVSLGGAVLGVLDVLTLFEPLFLSAALVLIAICVWSPAALNRPTLRWRFCALGVAGALCASFLVLPDMVAGWTQPRPTGAPAPTLRLLTENVWGRNRELGATALAILRADADVVLLQELDGPIRELPKSLAAAYPYRADCTTITEWCSMAILSKRPILSWTHHEPAWRPPEWDRLGLVRVKIDGGAAGPIEIATTHLMHPDHHGAAAEQTAQFLRAIADLDTRRGIIAGDFNSPPSSFALRRIDAGIPVPRRTHGLASWPNHLPWGAGHSRWPFPFLAIDQVYAGRDWRVASIVRAPSTGSDHYGLIANLVLQP
jgi:endonuclease/exonuclease/phosphatase (EEP) superfamily protein YafD